jgi:hypothetical protein
VGNVILKCLKSICISYFALKGHTNQALRLKEEVAQEQLSQFKNTLSLDLVNQESVSVLQKDKLKWQYFDEKSYIDKTRIRPGQDAYARNKFNQEASDQLKSDRGIMDSRHPKYVFKLFFVTMNATVQQINDQLFTYMDMRLYSDQFSAMNVYCA